MLITDTLIISLGEIFTEDVARAVSEQFGPVTIGWFDRGELRRRPLRAVWRLLGRKRANVVLVAADLRQPRLRLTSFVLALARARRRWRVDLHGNREAWSVAGHLAANALPIVRHAAACVLALTVGGVALRAIERGVRTPKREPSRPKKWLYLRSQLWLGLEGGGSVAHTAGVIGGLQEAGADVTVVSSDRLPGVSAPTRIVSPETWFDGWLREVEDLTYNVSFFTASLRASRRSRPDAIYQRHTAFNCAGAVLSRLLRLPLVLEFNSSEVWKGRHWGGLRMTPWAAAVERINLRAADRVIVVSDVLRDGLIRGGVPASKILVNPNGVDPRVFRPDAGGTNVRQRLGLGSDVVIGFSGTFGEWHGIPTLAAALQLVLEARPQACWLLIGDGPLRGLIDNAVDTHELNRRVQRVGMVRHAEMPAYLAACDILVSPHGRQADGREFFGSPTKLFEYMASGRPIVASAIGQIAEVLIDERTALLVPPDDADALAARIVRLVDDACLRARLGQAARLAAERHHTWRQNAERVLDCLGAA